MCGIIGYIGESSAAENLLDGLKNLEYRGYDSAGIALNDNNRLKIFKAAGSPAIQPDLEADASGRGCGFRPGRFPVPGSAD